MATVTIDPSYPLGNIWEFKNKLKYQIDKYEELLKFNKEKDSLLDHIITDAYNKDRIFGKIIVYGEKSLKIVKDSPLYDNWKDVNRIYQEKIDRYQILYDALESGFTITIKDDIFDIINHKSILAYTMRDADVIIENLNKSHWENWKFSLYYKTEWI